MRQAELFVSKHKLLTSHRLVLFFGQGGFVFRYSPIGTAALLSLIAFRKRLAGIVAFFLETKEGVSFFPQKKKISPIFVLADMPEVED